MHSLATARRATTGPIIVGQDLTADELDAITGGAADPLSWAVLIFAGSVVVGILDRIFFGGCRCR